MFSSDVDNMLAESGEAINQALEVADQGRGTTPLTESITVGDMGVAECGELPLGANAAVVLAFEPGLRTPPLSNEHSADSQMFLSSLDHFTNRITRCVDKKLGRETELAEVGQ